MMKDRRKYDRDFKKEVVRIAEEGERSVSELAEDLGLHRNLIYKWSRQLKEEGEEAFPGKGHMKTADEELRRLRRELDDVKEERDILKKALAIFSKRTR